MGGREGRGGKGRGGEGWTGEGRYIVTLKQEITYTTIKGTVTMALGISTVCTYVYDNSKCIGAERRRAPLLLWPIIYKLSVSYKQ